MLNRILVIDGTYLAYKSYYATLHNPVAVLKNSKGESTNEIVGFFNVFISLVNNFVPSHVFIAFDSQVKTFRHETLQDYKANRKKASPDFYKQLNSIQKLLNMLNIKNQFVNGFEADDIIAKIVSMFSSEAEILIYSGDQDLNQLISDNVSIIKKIKSETVILDKTNFKNYYDFNPNQVIDYKAIVGDSSDNFKGVAGLGTKSAIELLSIYGTLENIYFNLDKLKPSVKEKLIANKEEALRDKYLASLRTDFDI
ncbi:DNA polymerase I [Chlamydia abortus]|nr:DNA polymerase I [Chlamydia abortus]SHE14888.1 DNA polymerase I [Chlamydia abortus]